MDSLQNSTVIAGYRIDGALGEGGMGTVYRATQLSLERVVALKVLTSEFSSDPAFRERFRREGLLQAALDHPHIVTVYEAGETEQRLFLAMQMVAGPTLKDLIVKRQLGDRRALRLLTQVAEALDAAHSKALIHRDVKPQNVLVGAGDHAFLADFGLTRGDDDAPMTATGMFVGTIDYISPEQARGERATPRSDVYALTAVLYECLTGQVPYVRATEERALLAHLTEDPPSLSELRSDLPSALDEVIARGMAKDAASRPASARELMLSARRAVGALPAADSARIASAPAASHARETDDGTGSAVVGAAGTTIRPAHSGVATPAPATSPPTTDARPEPTTVGRRGFGIAVAVAALVAAALGGWLGGSHGSSRAQFGNSASAGNLELSFPTGWRRVSPGPRIPGLTFLGPIALAPAGASAQGLLAGQLTASGPSLLAPALLAQLAVQPTQPTAVALGNVTAYRYDKLSVRGLAVPLTVYVTPSTAGVATIACLAVTATVSRECAQIAATLKLISASAFALTPSQAYAGALSRTFLTLQRVAANATGRLASAKSASAQATAADRLASAFDAAGVSVAKLTVSPAVQAINEGLVRALDSSGRAYRALASAARPEDRAAYARASQAVTKARGELAQSLQELAKAGYTIHS
ncbi:MAG: protein kinase [Solirubrobacterales bacterium]|jgi:hypothetical protein|nr:protein kinase [Solirubrobacterales bacterium]